MATHADHLRDALVDQLLETGAVRTPRVEAALRAVPRHVFVPDAPLRRAYADDVVQTKVDSDGIPISAASQPSIVAVMLEQLAVEPGMRILEIGAGTGYNAGLLAHLTGDGGSVVTLDVDDDIVDGARAALAGAGFPGVTVIRGDGALGYALSAPYDRIIATVGARDVPLAWQDQLAPAGRIVVPLRLRGGVTRSVAFTHAPEAGPVLRSVSSVMCGFMPMRASIASDERETLPLTPSGDVLLEIQQEQRDGVDPGALDGVFATEPVTVRTGVRFGDAVSAEWLYLWLTCTLDSGLFRMQVRQSAIDAGLVAPLFRWGAVGTVAGGSLAYLAFGAAEESHDARPDSTGPDDTGPDDTAPDDAEADDTGADDAGTSGAGSDSADSGLRREVDVIGHGPRGSELAETMAKRIRTWDASYRTRAARFEIWPAGMASGSAALTGREDLFVFPTVANTLVVSWQHESENLHLPSRTSADSPV